MLFYLDNWHTFNGLSHQWVRAAQYYWRTVDCSEQVTETRGKIFSNVSENCFVYNCSFLLLISCVYMYVYVVQCIALIGR